MNNVFDVLRQVLSLEAVACKDWLTNKVDRSVTGRVAMQQCAGELQLPLNNLGIMALDYCGARGIATAIGHAPAVALISAEAGSRLAIAEALTNLVWAPIEGGLRGVSLSANWMWPCKNEGEDARLYRAVQAASDFALALGLNIPTGKDSLSMTQKYPDGTQVYAPGTVIISAVGEVSNLRKAISPVLKPVEGSVLLYLNMSRSPLLLGGSSAEQACGSVGGDAPDVVDAEYFARSFAAVQALLDEGLALSGHDVSAGGLITTLLEMNFANVEGGLEADLSSLGDLEPALFAENPAVVVQVANEARAKEVLHRFGVEALSIGTPIPTRLLRLYHGGKKYKFDIDQLRDVWYQSSYLLDRRQSGEAKAAERFASYKQQPVRWKYPQHFGGKFSDYGVVPSRTLRSGIRAAVVREKGSQCERETAWALHLAGFDVRDVHTTDLIAGRETLDDVSVLVFVGGFSNSDVLGSAKGWAGALLFNERAKLALDRFYARPDVLSLGICNGCQLMVELGLLTPHDAQQPRMLHNDSHKFESGFVSVEVAHSSSAWLGSLAGATLGIWVAHGEGKFDLPLGADHYNVALRYAYNAYPANPNGSPQGVAGISSPDGRHLAMMPHPERAIHPWTCPTIPDLNRHDDVTPWFEMFVNARKWVEASNGKG
jgi:phosphoribosylformylglycinamidine synthase